MGTRLIQLLTSGTRSAQTSWLRSAAGRASGTPRSRKPVVNCSGWRRSQTRSYSPARLWGRPAKAGRTPPAHYFGRTKPSRVPARPKAGGSSPCTRRQALKVLRSSSFSPLRLGHPRMSNVVWSRAPGRTFKKGVTMNTRRRSHGSFSPSMPTTTWSRWLRRRWPWR